MIDEPEGDKTLLVESLPRADADCRIRQEYVCDLCHRVLGRHSEEARRHMAKYQHPSVSWCNTVSHRNQVRFSLLYLRVPSLSLAGVVTLMPVT
mgnify:CR=1 FL=1